ncbi:MAG: acyltransferase domain-containing protein, partial [Gammaproteobacteria bacterium]|nr:acyltransferase domain-containing protein [Gammaproteobacteria bacterium]NIR81732.1 acyltransferase domain-containing protein [Gammaproteobacteria bacterium]NIR88535.1 acyltransferase domain-containing protein [Gammaproteobacteria bacterium]NIU02839.1 acyltransferase domain-containing protein [Gammaproteobacteria bacterium]NIV50361.1 acyltransferase domain-containing protein [Gammaproteobacteria bacterium]
MAVVGAALLDARGRGLRHYWDLLRGTSDGRPRESGSAVPRAHAEVEAAAGLARTALADSGHASLRSRVAVIVAPTSGAGAAVTDAERIARILGLAGPRIEAKPASVDGMIQAARQCLAEDSCDVALLGAFRVGKWGAGADAADSLLGAMLAVEPEGRARRGGRRVQAVLHPDGGSWHGLAAIAHALSPRGGAPALAGIGWIAWGAPLAEETPPPPAEDDAHAPLLPRLAVDPWGGEADNPLAGLAALLRAILALHHRVKPPAAAVVAGREVPALHPPFYVSAGLGPWIHGGEGPRRALFVEPAADAASTSLLVEEAGDADSAEGDLPWPTELVCVSAATRSGLLSRIERLTDYAARHPHAALADLAGALAAGPHDRERLVVIATDLDDLVDKLATVRHRLETTASSRIRSRAGIFYGPSRAVGREAKVAFLFPGQGSQFAGMGAELCVYMPAVRRWFDRLDATFDDGVPPSTLLFAPRTALAARAAREVENYLLSMEGGAQAGFVLNLAIHETLAGVGVRPDVLVGYSNGENSALIAAGALPRDANLIFHCLRELRGGVADGDAAAHIPRAAMMAVSQFEAHGIPDLLEAMDGRVYWAMDNCPGQMVLCAQTSALKEARERLRRAGALCLMLPFDRAYHTPWFEKKAKDLRDIYDALDVRPWHTPVYSCVTADLFPLEPDAIRALATRQWHSRVRFRETVERLHDEGVRIFIESGPDAKLTAFVDDTLKNRPHLAIPANRERRGALRQLQEL